MRDKRTGHTNTQRSSISVSVSVGLKTMKASFTIVNTLVSDISVLKQI